MLNVMQRFDQVKKGENMNDSYKSYFGLKSLAMLSLVLTTCSVLAVGGEVTARLWEAGDVATSDVTSAGDVVVNFEAVGDLGIIKTMDLIVGGTSPSSLFKGDLSEYTAIRFKILSDGTVATVKVRMNAPMRPWFNATPSIVGAAGDWTVNTIPFLIAQGWTSPWAWENWAYTPSETFTTDMKAIENMVLTLTPNGAVAQSYTISQFQLISDAGATLAAQLTPIGQYFDGVSSIDELTAAQRAQDSDGDGMSDLNEILAGMDPLDSSSLFAAKLAVTDNGNRIDWQGAFGETYGVLRSTDLTAGFVYIAVDLSPDYDGQNMEYIDTDPVEGSANFYKIYKY